MANPEVLSVAKLKIWVEVSELGGNASRLVGATLGCHSTPTTDKVAGRLKRVLWKLRIILVRCGGARP